MGLFKFLDGLIQLLKSIGNIIIFIGFIVAFLFFIQPRESIYDPLRGRSTLTFRQTIGFGFTLKLIRDMIITYSQMHCTDKNSKHSLIILKYLGRLG